jgi:hypothetical protein
MVGDGYEPEVTDATLRVEIELLADVIAAAGQVEDRFTAAQLDRVLGLAPPDLAQPREAEEAQVSFRKP